MNRNAANSWRWVIGAGVVLLGVVAVELWQPMAPRAAQGLDNPADDRVSLLAEARKTNERLDKIIALLEGGKVKVSLANAEELRVPTPAASEQKSGAPAGQDENRVIIMQKNGHE